MLGEAGQWMWHTCSHQGFGDRHFFKISLLGLCSQTQWLIVVVVNGRILFAEKLNKNRLANHEAISVGKERA